MIIFSVLFQLSSSVISRREKSIVYSIVAVLALISSAFVAYNLQFNNFGSGIGLLDSLSNATGISQRFWVFIMLITPLIIDLISFYSLRVLHLRKVGFRLLKQVIVSKMVLAIIDKCLNTTFKEICFIIFIRILIITIVYVIGCYNQHAISICRFIGVIVFINLLPYIYKKHEKSIINIIDNCKVKDILYILVYNRIISLSISIIILLIIYYITNNFEWNIIIIESIVCMWPWGQGSSNVPSWATGVNNTGGGSQGPQPPQGPQSSLLLHPNEGSSRNSIERKKSSDSLSGMYTSDPPDVGQPRGDFASTLKPFKDSIIYKKILEFEKEHPDVKVDRGVIPFLDPTYNRDIVMGYYRTTTGRWLPYHQHCYHEETVRVFINKSLTAQHRDMAPCVFPNLYYKSSAISGLYINLEERTLRNNYPLVYNKEPLYVLDSKGEYHLFATYPGYRLRPVKNPRIF